MSDTLGGAHTKDQRTDDPVRTRRNGAAKNGPRELGETPAPGADSAGQRSRRAQMPCPPDEQVACSGDRPQLRPGPRSPAPAPPGGDAANQAAGAFAPPARPPAREIRTRLGG